MRRYAPALLAAAFLAGCHGSSSVPAAGGVTPGSRSCERSSWVAGTTELCRGQLIYRDYVYDDYGADAGIVSLSPAVLNALTRAGALGSPLATTPGLLSPTAGDVRYPAGLDNTADLVSLSLSIQGNELVADFELNTLYHADDAIAALAIDTDNDASTGGGAWEGLGIESRGWEMMARFAEGNPDTNRIVGRLPLPPGSTWRVQAVVAQKDGKVMNVAFRGPHEEAKADGLVNQVLPASGNWWEDRQSVALREGDISDFGEVVSVADLRGGATRAAAKVTGFQQRVYTSQYTLPPGEGVDIVGVPGVHGATQLPCEQRFNYLGKYQPYGVYIPAKPGPHAAQLLMHGCEANHGSQVNQASFQQRFGEEPNRIIIAPLGRGPHGFFSGISERDVLDTLADIRANYPVDDEQILVSGYSMGGFGTLRFAALYPDLFAGAVNWVGFTGDLFNLPIPGNPLPPAITALSQTLGASIPPLSAGGAVGGDVNIIDYVGNLRHLPIASLYSGADELVHVTSSLAMGVRMGEEEIPYQFFLHPVAEHLSYLIFNDWRKEAAYVAGLKRVRNPARVTYKTDAKLDAPEYAIRHDSAYWVSQIVAEAEGPSLVDLTSLGCGIAQPLYQTGLDAGIDPVPWTATLRRRLDNPTVPAAEGKLSGTLANVRSLRIDAAGSCLRGKAVQYQITTDVPVTLTLSDGRAKALAAGTHSGSF
ncbi:hypothetical protein C3942_10290 [Solimonas fluminis]|uniref:Peptidase S9 prolyl oligopeptidase catalytic domain-containing protein n=1 Tax=Solimonas fluminis TaxID=2086571 RepID=A0A2S5TFS8_9GAMM|nr:hypothetical protein [Solimonas fluminis]PPE73792.1 hypothetical protein C3942_10290 [Solimonas fluminis]